MSPCSLGQLLLFFFVFCAAGAYKILRPKSPKFFFKVQVFSSGKSQIRRSSVTFSCCYRFGEGSGEPYSI